GSTGGHPNRAYFAAMASRIAGDPHVTGYWFTPALMACRAASLTSSGASKSGKPWARLMARCSSARRVISRITDSVNRETRAGDGLVSMPGSLDLGDPLEGKRWLRQGL